MTPNPYLSPSERLWKITQRVLCWLILIFLLTPILVIVPLSFSEGSLLLYPMPGVSLRWYEALFSSEDWIRATRNSFIVAPLSTVIATVLGTMAAMGLQRANFIGKSLLMGMLISPMIVPLVVVGVGVYLFFAPYGLTNSYMGLVLTHAALGSPFVLTTVLATLQGFDSNLVRAAYSLGAHPLRAFFTVTLPIIAPGVIAGALFAFITSFDEVITTLFLAGPQQVTLPRQMFTGIRENISPIIAAIATILIVFSTALLLTLEWLRGRNAKRAVRVDSST